MCQEEHPISLDKTRLEKQANNGQIQIKYRRHEASEQKVMQHFSFLSCMFLYTHLHRLHSAQGLNHVACGRPAADAPVAFVQLSSRAQRPELAQTGNRT